MYFAKCRKPFNIIPLHAIMSKISPLTDNFACLRRTYQKCCCSCKRNILIVFIYSIYFAKVLPFFRSSVTLAKRYFCTNSPTCTGKQNIFVSPFFLFFSSFIFVNSICIHLVKKTTTRKKVRFVEWFFIVFCAIVVFFLVFVMGFILDKLPLN